MKLYHATNLENLSDILDEGLKPSFEVIYFAESYEKALAFLALRSIDVVVFEVEVDIEQCQESFDHNESMFVDYFISTIVAPGLTISLLLLKILTSVRLESIT